MPQLEHKIDGLKRLQKDKIDLIKSGACLMHELLNKTLNNLIKFDPNDVIPHNVSVNQSIFSTFSMYEDNQITWQNLMQTTKNEEIRFILEKLNITRLIKAIIEQVMKIIYVMATETLNNKVAKKVNSMSLHTIIFM